MAAVKSFAGMITLSRISADVCLILASYSTMKLHYENVPNGYRYLYGHIEGTLQRKLTYTSFVTD